MLNYDNPIPEPNVMERSFQKLLSYFAWALKSGNLIVKEASNSLTLNNRTYDELLMEFKSDTTVQVSEIGQYQLHDLEQIDLSIIKIVGIYVVDYGEIDTSTIQYKTIDNKTYIDIPDLIMNEYMHYPIIISWIKIGE